MVCLTLTAYNMGNNATEDDFESWYNYVADRIDERCKFEVVVDYHRFVGGPAKDTIVAGTGEQRQIVREAVASLWEDWCADGTPSLKGEIQNG